MRTASKMVAAFLVAVASGSCSGVPNEDVTSNGLEVVTSVSQLKLVATSPAQGDQLGNAVAMSGDTIFVGDALDDVGTSLNQGSAFVYVRDGLNWRITQQLSNPSGANARFGRSVAMSGDFAVVGADGAPNVAGSGNLGAAFVFKRTSFGGWSLVQTLAPENGPSNDGFGVSAALDGDTLVIGGYSSAFAFTLANGTFGSRTKLVAPTGADGFASAIAVSGNLVLVGALSTAPTGAVYAYERSGTAFNLLATLTSSDAAPGSGFGRTVAVSGNNVLVGASQSVGGAVSRGVAYAFTRSGATFASQGKLQASDGVAGDLFGLSLALRNDVALIGAPFHEHLNQNSDHGSAYLFQLAGGVWTQQQELRANDGQNNDHFGSAVTMSGATAVVGSPNDDFPVAAQGSAYVFELTGVSDPGPVTCEPTVGSGFLQVAAGDGFTCGIKTDSKIVCWGRSDFNQAFPPCGTFTHVAAGVQVACAVRTGGGIVCWGDSRFGALSPPPGPVSTLSLNYQHACISRSNGPAVCWGSNLEGGTTTPSETFASVSAGSLHSCGLRADGSVGCWGATLNHFGQSNPPAGSFHGLVAGALTSCALRPDNTIQCWGLDVFPSQPAPSGTFRAIDLGQSFACGIRTDDTLTCWGSFGFPVPTGAFKSLSVGTSHACAIRMDDQLVCWGTNNFGELTPPA